MNSKQCLHGLIKALEEDSFNNNLFIALDTAMSVFQEYYGVRYGHKYGDSDSASLLFVVKKLIQARDTLNEYEKCLDEALAHLNSVRELEWTINGIVHTTG